MPEIPSYKNNSPESLPQSSKSPESKDHHDSPDHRMTTFLETLEQSDIASDLKEIAAAWLEHNTPEPQLSAVIDSFKKKGRPPSVGQLLEGIADVYLSQHPEMETKMQKGELMMPQVLEGMVDVLFQFALEQSAGDDRKARRDEVQRIVDRFKELATGA